MLIDLKNPSTNEIVTKKIGFSWTTLLFGYFVPLFRKDWKWFFIMLITGFLTSGISSIVLAFIYNKFHINDLLIKGFLPTNETAKQILIDKNFVAIQMK